MSKVELDDSIWELISEIIQEHISGILEGDIVYGAESANLEVAEDLTEAVKEIRRTTA